MVDYFPFGPMLFPLALIMSQLLTPLNLMHNSYFPFNAIKFKMLIKHRSNTLNKMKGLDEVEVSHTELQIDRAACATNQQPHFKRHLRNVVNPLPMTGCVSSNPY